MANQIISSGTVTINTTALRYVNDISFNKTLTGSNVIGTVDNISTQSYQALQTSSLSDIRYFIASNDNGVGSGSIIIASGSSGENRLAYLHPGDTILLPWSGSLKLYAFATNTTLSSSLLEYAIVEN